MINATQFRKDIYNVLDEVINTGQPVEISRKGKTLKIICEHHIKLFGENRPEIVKGWIIGKPVDLSRGSGPFRVRFEGHGENPVNRKEEKCHKKKDKHIF